ncbi:SDR family NAD(P)-dependent oxidoreductase [Mucilaginibacter phyllosphaerae]|uniref:NAD(P)-dependent dehydrogenase (Short-subunit alcohol dehydrogenase family) n=1 Tax=Mucilaginibacter phyllosphaerae TaxID=1812349 RepID=A0A4Y8A733_9SPHI|nr:SDR family NAD(P)-dependent oxidoreductase [Mucilaginibacter phyllosphaerae]MBB3970883.1 NAD(P)-dependent dehydrogenase (short-subunit alcohol dehydrogenase family) [Mucilaginibacter phyllosphaerae]TEW64182.1 SDR family NAD(P)-dependent oxidoreductase [Mucilaginibacter phyllosphaerae]GGH05203.1 short-chain dehydrogenase [Mucilaginibacter phyllosphaerae]
MPITTTVITGATSGIGKETALALAKKDHAIYMLVRDTQKAEEIRQEIISITKNKNIYIVPCNLADMESVCNAANTLMHSVTAINVLINNAGGIFADRLESKDGYEMTFAVNHLSHFLLFNKLLPLLQKGQARIINVSSEAHRIGKPDFNDLQWTKRPYSAWKAYGMAKLFNIYFTRAVATRFGPKGISAFALHPGLVNTGFGTGLTGMGKVLMWLLRPFMISAETGARTTIYLATASRIDSKSGGYFKNRHVASTSATDENGRNMLWDLSMEMIAPFLTA